MKARRFGQSLLLILFLPALCLGGGPAEGAPGATSSLQAVDDSASVTEDAPATAIDVLANDAAPDGTPNVIQSVDTTGTHGDVRIAGEPKRPPNIVFILTDDQSMESVPKMPFVGHYPGWDRFENAFLNDPVCCPSRASILTGLYAHHTGIENNADRSNFDDSSTIATWLHGAGYRTALFGKYHLLHNGAGPTYIPPGWDDWVGYPSGSYYDYTVNDNGQLVHYGSSPEDYSTDVISREAQDFLDQAEREEPVLPLPRDRGSPRQLDTGSSPRGQIRHRADPACAELQRTGHVRQTQLVAGADPGEGAGHRQRAAQGVRQPAGRGRPGQIGLRHLDRKRASSTTRSSSS